MALAFSLVNAKNKTCHQKPVTPHPLCRYRGRRAWVSAREGG